MRQFLAGLVVGAICALGAYFTLELPYAKENERISGFVNGAHLALMAADDELTDAIAADIKADGPELSPRMQDAVRHVRAWRGCGILGLSKDWPGAYERLQAVEALHPRSGWRAHIAASCSDSDLGDAK